MFWFFDPRFFGFLVSWFLVFLVFWLFDQQLRYKLAQTLSNATVERAPGLGTLTDFDTGFCKINETIAFLLRNMCQSGFKYVLKINALTNA